MVIKGERLALFERDLWLFISMARSKDLIKRNGYTSLRPRIFFEASQMVSFR